MNDQGPVLTLAVVAFQAMWPHWVIDRHEDGIAVDGHVHGDFRVARNPKLFQVLAECDVPPFVICSSAAHILVFLRGTIRH
eukprot:4502298-Amphidinium_carterae.1